VPPRQGGWLDRTAYRLRDSSRLGEEIADYDRSVVRVVENLITPHRLNRSRSKAFYRPDSRNRILGR
jgi:hypothetical protein